MDSADSIFRALGDGTRRHIFQRLAHEGELSVSALTAQAGVSQPAVSQHLRALREAGLVAETRAGRHVLYRANADGLKPLFDWMGAYGRFWETRIDALEDTLARMDI